MQAFQLPTQTVPGKITEFLIAGAADIPENNLLPEFRTAEQRGIILTLRGMGAMAKTARDTLADAGDKAHTIILVHCHP